MTSTIPKSAKFAVVIPVKKTTCKAINTDHFSSLPLEIIFMIFELTFWSNYDDPLLYLLPIARLSRKLLSAACLFRLPNNIQVPECSLRQLEHYVRPGLFWYCKCCFECYVMGDEHDFQNKWAIVKYRRWGSTLRDLRCPNGSRCDVPRRLPVSPIQGRRPEARVIPPPLEV